MNYYLGPWVWDDGLNANGDRNSVAHWRAPSGVVGIIDLRTLPEQSKVGGTPEGNGFFATPKLLGPEYTLIGTGDIKTIESSDSDKTEINSKIGYTPIGTTLNDVLFDLLKNGGDPKGETSFKPLMPTIDGALEVHLGGHSLIKTEQFEYGVHPHTAMVKAVLQEDYRKIKAQATIDGKDTHRRVLDKWGEEYKVREPHLEFIPNDLPVETPLPHATTLTESFNKADSSTLGPDQTWTELVNDLQVFSNIVLPVFGGSNYYVAYARAEADVSSANHYCSATANFQAGSDTGGWPVTWHVFTRYSSSVDTAYFAQVSEDNLVDTPSVWKNVTGTFTSLATGSTGTYANNDVLKNKSNGSTIDCLINDVVKATVTDTAITTGTRGGIGCSKDTHNGSGFGYTVLDNWELSDLAAGTNVNVQPVIGTFSIQTVGKTLSVSASPVNGTFSVVSVVPKVAVNALPVIGTFTVIAPTVQAGGSISKTVPPVVGTFTVVSPTIQVDKSVTVSPVVGIFSVVAPTVSAVSGGTSVTVSVNTGVFSVVAPTLSISVTFNASPIVGTFSVPASDRQIMKAAGCQTMAGLVGGVTPKVSVGLSPIQLIGSVVPFSSIQGSGKTVSVSPVVGIFSVVAPRIFAQNKRYRIFSKHGQPKNVTRHDQDKSVAKGGLYDHA